MFPKSPENPVFGKQLRGPKAHGISDEVAAHMAELNMCFGAIQDLVDGHRRSSFAKDIKSPKVFKQETRSEELQKWEDPKFSLENFIGVTLRMFLGHGFKDRQNRCEKLFSFLFTVNPADLVR